MELLDFSNVNINGEAPASEPERQYYYMAKARRYVAEKANEIGRSLTFCVTTFGCPNV